MRLYLGNLPIEATESVIHEELLKNISVTSVKVVRDPRTGRSRGFAFLDVASQLDGDSVVKTLNGTIYSGKKLLVSFAKEASESTTSEKVSKATGSTPTEAKPSRRKSINQGRRRHNDDEFNGPWH